MPTFFLDQGETLGGAEKFLLDFLLSLDNQEKIKISPIVLGAKNSDYQKILKEKNIKIIDFNFPSAGGNIFKKIFAIFRIIFAAWKLKSLTKKFDQISFFSNTPRTHFVMFIFKKILLGQGIWTAFFHDFTTRPKFLLKKICDTTDIIAVNSIPTRQFLRKNISSKNFDKIKIIENGIDIKKIAILESPKKLEKIFILGRIDPRKGQIFLVKAAEELQKKLPELKFFIVGESFVNDPRTTQYEKEIKKFIKTKNISNVEFLPFAKNPFEIISQMDLALILPTEKETFGRVVIENLVCNRFVLSFSETGPKEILQNFAQFVAKKRVTNFDLNKIFLCKKSDEKDLVQKIIIYKENLEQVQKIFSYGRSFVEKNYNLSETKKRLLDLF